MVVLNKEDDDGDEIDDKLWVDSNHYVSDHRLATICVLLAKQKNYHPTWREKAWRTARLRGVCSPRTSPAQTSQPATPMKPRLNPPPSPPSSFSAPSSPSAVPLLMALL
ncbi:hypothetical protein U1Q18_041464 [Sarracenia purpurea var. burkii]